MMSGLQGERRRSVRVPFDHSARAEQIPQSFQNDVFDLLSNDLSEGGVQLSSPEFFPLESLVVLDLDTPTPFRAVGRIAWSEQVGDQDRWRVGVEFTELSDDARSRLRKIVRQRQGARFRRP
jgi:hypothetical protein